MYIPDLEKEHGQKNIGPQVAEDVGAASEVVQDAIQKLKRFVDRVGAEFAVNGVRHQAPDVEFWQQEPLSLQQQTEGVWQ